MNTSFLTQMFNLDGRKAVVTGAGSGIGQATAVALANFGAEVIILGRTMEKLKRTEAEIVAIGGKCTSYAVDVTDSKQVEKFFATYKNEYGVLDIFVSNVGVQVRKNALETSEEEFDRLVNTNFKSGWRCLKYAGNIMRDQGKGNIVIVTSINGYQPIPNQAIYASTKFALRSLTETLAGTLAPYGVRVNACAPGAVLTDLTREVFTIKSVHDAKAAEIALGYIGQPMDIGIVIATMVTDAYRFMTGSCILVDGGDSLRKPMKMPAPGEK